MNVLQKIRYSVAGYFASKALELLKGSLQIRAIYPEGSVGYQYAPFFEAWADFYHAMAESIVETQSNNACT